jgi:hypothetical protein
VELKIKENENVLTIFLKDCLNLEIKFGEKKCKSKLIFGKLSGNSSKLFVQELDA